MCVLYGMALRLRNMAFGEMATVGWVSEMS
jgi:hypothetical protein